MRFSLKVRDGTQLKLLKTYMTLRKKLQTFLARFSFKVSFVLDFANRKVELLTGQSPARIWSIPATEPQNSGQICPGGP